MSEAARGVEAPARHRVETDELARALGPILDGGPAAVMILERRRFPYHSSFPLEELLVRRANGDEQWLIFKDLGDGHRTKPGFVHDPLREIETYRDVLAPHRLSVPAYRGAVIDPERRRYWLFLERVEGDLLWQVGEVEVWQRAARWLAELHARFAARPPAPPHRLIVHDSLYYLRWLERARRFVGAPEGSSASVRDLERLAAGTRRAVEWLIAQPVTFLHGELYPSNVVVERSAGGARIRPLDWEMAGVGPGLLDLAALTSGAWGDAERAVLVDAYRSALPEELRPGAIELRQGLDRCRLLLAVQWLGWSARWTPPPEHAHDWLTTALELADELTNESTIGDSAHEA